MDLQLLPGERLESAASGLLSAQGPTAGALALVPPARRFEPGMQVAFPADFRLKHAFDDYLVDLELNEKSGGLIEHYGFMVLPFLRWLVVEYPEVRDFPDLADLRAINEFRVLLKKEPGMLRMSLVDRRGRRIGRGFKVADAETRRKWVKALIAWLNWASRQKRECNGRIEAVYQVPSIVLTQVRPPKPARKAEEVTVFHVEQIWQILRGCQTPTERMAVRLLLGTGARVTPATRLSLRAPDGTSDFVFDSVSRGRAEVRIRGQINKNGTPARVSICRPLVNEIQRYIARERQARDGCWELLISQRHEPFTKRGLEQLCERLGERVGFRVHAHAFRHTMATVAMKMGWSTQHVRAALGHTTTAELDRYTKLAGTMDLGTREQWLAFVADRPVLEF